MTTTEMNAMKEIAKAYNMENCFLWDDEAVNAGHCDDVFEDYHYCWFDGGYNVESVEEMEYICKEYSEDEEE